MSIGTRKPNPMGPKMGGLPTCAGSGTAGAVTYSPGVPGGAVTGHPATSAQGDMVAEKIEVFERFHDRSETERKLRAFYAEGRLPDDVFKSLMNTARKEHK